MKNQGRIHLCSPIVAQSALDSSGRRDVYVGSLGVEQLGITMHKEGPEFLKGTLDMLILKIVALGPIHGYAISQRVQQISKDVFQLTQGSLYPALHRLEDRGWLKADWRDSNTGREAKFYTLTRKGQKQLEAEVLNWERLSGAVSLILRTVE
jgi:transcriptional regulator